MPKPATLVATVLAVCCPRCGEPQPDPEHGSDMWEPQMVRAENGKARTCVACDEGFVIHSLTRVIVHP